MYKTLELTLDTERTNNTKTNAQNFLVNTNDYESVKVIANIVQDKEQVDLTDATVKLAIRKPDKTIVFQSGTVTAALEGECEFVLETQSYILKGTHVAEVMIYFADEKIVVTRAFAYHVAEGILTDTAIESTSWYQDVNELQLAVQELQVEVDAFIDTAVAETRAEITEVDQRLTSQLAETAKKAEVTRLQEQPRGLVQRNSAIFETDFERRPLISFVSDDACIEDYTVFKPLFDSYGWKFTLAVQTAYVGTTDKYNKPIMTWEQLREMYNEGYTVCSHTVNHEKLAEITPEQADYELRASREILLNKGFDVRHIMYPNGSVNETVYNLSKKYYLSGGTILNGQNTTDTSRERVNRYSVLNNTITTLKAAVDLAVANNTWIVFYIHGFEVTDYPTFLPKLQELMAYINTSGVKVLPYDDGYDMFVRKAPLVETHRVPHIRYTMTASQNVPTTASADILMPSFGWNSSDFADVFSKDTVNNRFVIKKPGLYLVEYTLLIEAEAGSQVTVSLASGGVNVNNTTIAKGEKQQSFVQGGTINVSGGTLKAIPVSGQFVVHFNPDVYKEVHVHLNAFFRGQSGNATNKILAYQDTSHLSITRLSM